MSRSLVEDIFRRINDMERRLHELEGHMADYLKWARRRNAILLRAKRQRGRNVVVLFPRAKKMARS